MKKFEIHEVAGTRQRSNLIAKLCRPTASLFQIDPTIFQKSNERKEIFLQTSISRELMDPMNRWKDRSEKSAHERRTRLTTLVCSRKMGRQ